MEPTTPSQNLLNLEGADFVGKTLIGHPADGGRPCTLGTVTGVRHHSQSTVIDLEKKGTPSKIALERATWKCEGDTGLVDCTSPPSEEGQLTKRTYVRLTTKPSMTAVQMP